MSFIKRALVVVAIAAGLGIAGGAAAQAASMTEYSLPGSDATTIEYGVASDDSSSIVAGAYKKLGKAVKDASTDVVAGAYK
ncbi:hypothetical protein ACIQUM_03865 [Amycolatopsis azurea]|uniref:hypothetical protein n=1 Tax=Amycolatopsis azurea TaxID=36819 RepID=UPI003815D85F